MSGPARMSKPINFALLAFHWCPTILQSPLYFQLPLCSPLILLLTVPLPCSTQTRPKLHFHTQTFAPMFRHAPACRAAPIPSSWWRFSRCTKSPLHFRQLSLCFHLNLGKVGLWHRSQAEVTQIRQTVRWTVLHFAPNWVFNSCVYGVFQQPPLSGLGVTDARELSYNHSA